MKKGYLNVRMNISKFNRDLGAMTRGPNSMYSQGGRELRAALMEEFETLVKETPQFSGSTAASWQIGFPGDLYGGFTPGDDFVQLPKPANGIEAMKKGMNPAIDISITRAKATLFSTDPDQYMTKDLVIVNNAPGFETAEEGPVRQVNDPARALDRCRARWEAKIIK